MYDDERIYLKDVDVEFRWTTETNYRFKVGNKLLKVEVIWYFIKYYVVNFDVVYMVYMKVVIVVGFLTLFMLDRKDLIAYLTGERVMSD